MEEIVAARRRFLPKVEALIRERVVPRLSQGGSPFQIEVPEAGVRSLVYRLCFKEGPFYIVRFVPSWIEARQLIRVCRFFEGRDAPVPRLVFSDLSLSVFITSGHGMLVEEGISGAHLDSLRYSDKGLEAAAAALARTHRVTRSRWGHLGLGSLGSYFGHVHKRTRRRLAELIDQDVGLGDKEGEEIFRRLGKFKARFVFPRGYSLCHMRINLHNLLVSEEGTGYLIDLTKARFADPGIDLVRARHRWCLDVPEKVALFDARYSGELGGVTPEEIGSREPYHHAVFHLAQANRTAKRMGRLISGQSSYWQGQEGLASELEAHIRALRGIANSAQ